MFIFPGVPYECVFILQAVKSRGGGEEEVVFQHKSPNEIEKKNPYCRQGSLSVWESLGLASGKKFCMKACLLSGPVLNTPSENIHLSVYFQWSDEMMF